MKTSTLKRGGRNTPLPLGLILGAALFCGLASGARAQNDPSGDWDCVISGNQQGVAFLTFNKDTTITGFEVITSYTPPESPDGRGLGFNNDRNDVSSGSTTNHVLVGLFPITGNWGFDSKGRTIGFITEGDDVVRQGGSFIATVKPGRRLTMKVVDSPDPTMPSFQPRQHIYKGIPLDVADDVSGDFYANGTQNSITNGFEQKFVEFFNLSSADSVTNFPEIFGSPASANAYFLTGSGPGYTNIGLALFSGQNKMAIVSRQFETSSSSNSILRSVAGGFNVRSGINGAGKLLGTDDDVSRINYKVKRF
jgi:hypothetical protein